MAEITEEMRRHSAAHLMARAIMNIFEDVQVDIGPATDEGFYYDFDLPHRITPEDFPKIEAEIARFIALDEPFVRKVVSADEAKELLERYLKEGTRVAGESDLMVKYVLEWLTAGTRDACPYHKPANPGIHQCIRRRKGKVCWSRQAMRMEEHKRNPCEKHSCISQRPFTPPLPEYERQRIEQNKQPVPSCRRKR